MSYPIDITVPNEPNDPVNDVTPMRSNFINISRYLSVDHIAPGALGNGFHKQVTYNQFTAPLAPVGETGISFVKAGVALNTAPQNYFINSQGTFPISAIKAFGQFATVAAPTVPTFTNSFNINTGSASRSGFSYVIPLVSNCVSGNDILVFFSFSNNTGSGITSYSYTFTNPNLTIVVPPANNNILVNFMVIQI